MTNLVASALGTPATIYNLAIANEGCSMSMTNVTAVAVGAAGDNIGLRNWATSEDAIVSDHCAFEGTTGSIVTSGDPVLRIGASKLTGGISGGGSFTCAASYDGNYASLDATCR